MMKVPNVSISIVVIARNEENFIERCLRSIMKAVINIGKVEVLLVDSASTDRTIEIAKPFPIRIVTLDSTRTLTASAGRYIGQQLTKGELIQFIDGDMEIAGDWLEKARAYMVKARDVGGITGFRHDVYSHQEQLVAEDEPDRDPQGRILDALYIGGAAMYRREALEKVGGFNPYIISREEYELGIRLRRAGYRLLRLPEQICTNYSVPLNTWEYLFHKLRSRMFSGYGQILRYHVKDGLLMEVLKEGYLSSFLGFLSAIVIVGLGLLLGDIRFYFFVLLAACIFVVLRAIQMRSLRRVVMGIIIRVLTLYGIVRGFLKRPGSPADYPKQVRIIK